MTNKKHITSDKSGSSLQDIPEIVGFAYQYHLRGLTAKEIGKLLDVSQRTVQRWFTQYEFEKTASVPTGPQTIQQKAVAMANAGLSYSQVAKKLRLCKATIYNYVKAAKKASLEKPG